ncbi:DUF2235 domain-containing protein [Streptomyces fulvoviolaceus]|uniref:DUF2235 domain-containing protein n=1 Tax=Streptomyces fulvoviolaceus TaxID=285535 RepID=UPI0021C1576C|nr:DUF2235 domain-containing protein [Streptomyces fulvoviolaceus]MCT9082924.1 DUF2235 domain-containing protein [Streptomyces fulvoviolaceus]
MAKNLVICCDGTWNRADQPNRTNVAKVALAVRGRSATGMEQRLYYHSGVGTSPGERLRGGAFGFGLSRNVIDAYRFLVSTFEPGDLLYLFGFSRGAYTARSLAGLVRNSGILRPDSSGRVGDAWDLYRNRTEKPSETASVLFRRAYAYETEIRFMGVWDTVGSLGIPVPAPNLLRPLAKLVNSRWAFHDTTLSSWVNGAFHALAVDEKRRAFEPTLWNQQPDAVSKGQELKQVWFTGVHVDIGGGYPDTSLSDLTLRWMTDQAIRYGLELDDTKLPTPPPRPMGELHNSRTKLFRLTRPLHRPIGKEKDGCEYLAATAKQRYDGDTGYRPPGLVTYLRDFGGGRTDPKDPPTPGE